MKTWADILRERGKLGPYTTEEPVEPVDSAVVAVEEQEPRRRRPRTTLPPVDF